MQRTTATETLSSSWAKKLEIKAKRQAIMAMEKEMRDAKLQEIEVYCRRRFQCQQQFARLSSAQHHTTFVTLRGLTAVATLDLHVVTRRLHAFGVQGFMCTIRGRLHMVISPHCSRFDVIFRECHLRGAWYIRKHQKDITYQKDNIIKINFFEVVVVCGDANANTES